MQNVHTRIWWEMGVAQYCQPSFGSPEGAEKLLQEIRLPGVPVCQASVNARVRVYRLANVTVMNF